MYEQGSSRLNDFALHQLRRQTPDQNVTFIGGRIATGVPVRDGTRTVTPHVVLWIARHSVLPDQPQPRAVSLVEPDSPPEALLNSLVEAILPSVNKNLAPLMPGRIEVADDTTAQVLRSSLKGITVDVAVAEDMTLVESIAAGLVGDLRRQFAPISPWEAPAEVVRELAATAASLYRRDPWEVLHESPPVAIAVNRYGVETFYLSLTYGPEDNEGVIAYRSYDDYLLAAKTNFIMSELEDAGGEIINLDMTPEDIAHAEHIVRHPENGMGEAITLYFEPASDLHEDTLAEIRKLKLPMTSKQAVPIFTRMAREGDPRRPDTDEARALRLALDAFNQFFSRHRERIEDEAWHLAPIVSNVSVKDGAEKVPVKVSITSHGPTLAPELRDSVLTLRVMLADDTTVWREIEILGNQPLWELEHSIHEAFGWPMRFGSFLPRDLYDGDDNYETLLIEDAVTSEGAPIGVLVSKPRDLAHFMFDPREKSVSHRIRLMNQGPRLPEVEYPRVMRSHGDTPPIYTPEDYEISPFDDELDFDIGSDDDDEE